MLSKTCAAVDNEAASSTLLVLVLVLRWQSPPSVRYSRTAPILVNGGGFYAALVTAKIQRSISTETEIRGLLFYSLSILSPPFPLKRPRYCASWNTECVQLL